MNKLINELTVRYGPPTRKCNSTTTTNFKVDDEAATDRYPGFCRIWLAIPDQDDRPPELELTCCPHNSTVTDLVTANGGRTSACPYGTIINMPVHQPRSIRDLAKAIRRTTARGERYPDANWKWIAPRTADALQRLASCLAAAARSRRSPAKA